MKEQLEELALTGRIAGKRSRGRQRLMYLGWLQRTTDIPPLELVRSCKRGEEDMFVANVRIWHDTLIDSIWLFLSPWFAAAMSTERSDTGEPVSKIIWSGALLTTLCNLISGSEMERTCRGAPPVHPGSPSCTGSFVHICSDGSFALSWFTVDLHTEVKWPNLLHAEHSWLCNADH